MESFSHYDEKITTISRHAFAISEPSGNVRHGTQDGFYSADTRFLSSFRVRFDGADLQPVGVDVFGFSLVSFYTVPSVDGAPSAVSIVRDRLVGEGLHEDVYVVSHLPSTRDAKLEISFDADFADIFEVRRGNLEPQETSLRRRGSREVILSYNTKRFHRSTTIAFSKEPKVEGRRAVFDLHLLPQRVWNVCIGVTPGGTTEGSSSSSSAAAVDSFSSRMACVKTILPPPFGHDRDGQNRGEIDRPKRGPLDIELPTIETESPRLAAAFDRCIDDLRALQMEVLDGRFVLAAGLPWFMALFGRDSIISAFQTKLLGQGLMVQTLDVLAHFQATRSDRFREADPGKIPHEVRRGKLSSEEKIPHSHYYGSVDATPLFIILLSEAYRWTGDAELIERFLHPVESALTWISEYGDIDGDGFVEYRGARKKASERQFGLRNQGWKDSDDSVSFHDGSLAEPPIALAEVQGYVYAAKIRMAELCEVLGNEERATELKREAEGLKVRFNDRYWMPKKGYYAMALDGSKEQVDTITSNIGHCLWTEIIDHERAGRVVKRLLSEDMFSDWGIRTLSTEEVRYNPLSYHNGSVWPHDTSIAAAGIARYGFLREANRVCEALLDAAMRSHDLRLPELFGGYPRREGSAPVPYPGANRPQAWSSGALIYCIETLLGVMPKGDHLLLEARTGGLGVALKGVAYRGSKRTL
jgi:glycogen debranching enzyme